MGELNRGERLQIMLTDDELRAGHDWRFGKSMASLTPTNQPRGHNRMTVPHHGKLGLNRGAMLALRTGHNSRWGAPSQWPAAPARYLIVIDTLDKLAARG